jgi:cytoskeletal protein RodZ
MRSRLEPLLVAFAVCGVLGGTRLLSAQEAPPAAATPTEAATSAEAGTEAKAAAAAEAAARAAKGEAETDADARPAAGSEPSEATAGKPPPKAVGATPGRFEPTEKVRADFDVSFPIDI